MKIKLPFTEKFLWDLYNFIDEAKNLMPRLHPKRYGLPFSDFNIFRDEWTNVNKKKYEKTKSRKRFTWLVQRLKQEGYLKTFKYPLSLRCCTILEKFFLLLTFKYFFLFSFVHSSLKILKSEKGNPYLFG